MEEGYRADGKSPEAASSPSSAQQRSPPKAASKSEAVSSKRQMYEDRGYKVATKPRSVAVSPLAGVAPVTTAAAPPHRVEPSVPQSIAMGSVRPSQLNQRRSQQCEEVESTSSESTALSQRMGRARSHDSVMPRQPRGPRWNLQEIEFRPPEIPLRDGRPVRRQSGPVRAQIEPAQSSRSSSREEPYPPRKRHRHESGDRPNRVDPREIPQVFSPRDMREIRGMLRSRAQPPHRPYKPRASEIEPAARGRHRADNLLPLLEKRDRARFAAGGRGVAERTPRRERRYEDRYWSGVEKKMKYRE